MLDLLGVGAGPQPLGSPGAASLISYPVETFQTPLLDLAVPNLNIEFIPAREGFVAWRLSSAWIIETALGTQTTPPVVRAGSDAARTNFLPSTSSPSSANVNASVGNVPSLASGIGNVNSNQANQKIPGATVYLDVVSGGSGSGGYALLARLVVNVMWMTVG